MASTLLAIELSSSKCTAAVYHGGKFSQLDFSAERGKGVVVAIERLLEQQQISPQQLETIYVGIGPGSYTGLRIACSAGLMLAYSLNINCVGINSFEALAWRESNGNAITVLLDAYRKQYYHAEYQVENEILNVISEPTVIDQDDWHGNNAINPQPEALDILNFVCGFISKHPEMASKHTFEASPLYLRPPAFRQ